MFDNEMNAVTTTENEAVDTAVETTKKRRGRVAKPTMTLAEALDKFDSDEVKAFSAEWGRDKLKAILVKIDGTPTAFVPADAGKGFSAQDYAKTREKLSIIDSAYPVAVKLI